MPEEQGKLPDPIRPIVFDETALSSKQLMKGIDKTYSSFEYVEVPLVNGDPRMFTNRMHQLTFKTHQYFDSCYDLGQIFINVKAKVDSDSRKELREGGLMHLFSHFDMTYGGTNIRGFETAPTLFPSLCNLYTELSDSYYENKINGDNIDFTWKLSYPIGGKLFAHIPIEFIVRSNGHWNAFSRGYDCDMEITDISIQIKKLQLTPVALELIFSGQPHMFGMSRLSMQNFKLEESGTVTVRDRGTSVVMVGLVPKNEGFRTVDEALIRFSELEFYSSVSKLNAVACELLAYEQIRRIQPKINLEKWRDGLKWYAFLLVDDPTETTSDTEDRRILIKYNLGDSDPRLFENYEMLVFSESSAHVVLEGNNVTHFL